MTLPDGHLGSPPDAGHVVIELLAKSDLSSREPLQLRADRCGSEDVDLWVFEQVAHTQLPGSREKKNGYIMVKGRKEMWRKLKKRDLDIGLRECLNKREMTKRKDSNEG